MGAYHTLSLELQRKFTLTKENWDAIALERVEEACDSGASSLLTLFHVLEGYPNHNPSDWSNKILYNLN